jgi:hypothetical protein
MGLLKNSIADRSVTTREFSAIRAVVAGFWREIDRLAALLGNVTSAAS